MSYRDCKLYVGNLSSTATRTDLDKEFGYYGRLVNVWVARNPPGFAYVEYEDARDARDAVRGLDGKDYMGRKLRVEVAHGMPRSRQGGWSGASTHDRRRAFDPNDRCYNCGESGHYAYDCASYRRSSSRRSRSRSRRRSRSRSRSYRKRRSHSRSPRRSYSRSPRRSFSRSRSPSPRRGRSRSPRRSPSRSKSRSASRKRSVSPDRRSRSRSSSRSRSRSR